MHDDREHMLARLDHEAKRRVRPLVPRVLDAVDEHGRRVVDALKAKRHTVRASVEASPVDPGALGDPFREQRVATVVGVRHLARARKVVEDAPRDAGRQPAGRIPRLVGPDVPAPFVAEAAAHLPAVLECRYHSSRSTSVIGASRSYGMRNVFTSCGPKSASSTLPRSGRSSERRPGRPALS